MLRLIMHSFTHDMPMWCDPCSHAIWPFYIAESKRSGMGFPGYVIHQAWADVQAPRQPGLSQMRAHDVLTGRAFC